MKKGSKKCPGCKRFFPSKKSLAGHMFISGCGRPKKKRKHKKKPAKGNNEGDLGAVLVVSTPEGDDGAVLVPIRIRITVEVVRE